jgi:hypothetical protein
MDVIYLIWFRCRLYTVCNLNYTPTTLGVKCWRQITFEGTRTKNVVCHWFRGCLDYQNDIVPFEQFDSTGLTPKYSTMRHHSSPASSPVLTAKVTTPCLMVLHLHLVMSAYDLNLCCVLSKTIHFIVRSSEPRGHYDCWELLPVPVQVWTRIFKIPHNEQ